MSRASIETIKADVKAIVELVNTEFGANYATKNPALVQHLLDKVQQEESREFERVLTSGKK